MPLELLAPARNPSQGILALRCGADAIYMGPSRFGARQSASCTMADFESLTREARLWGAKVYATLNTLIFDHELEEVRRLAWQLFEAGVDALIVQDMALLEMDLPPLPLHASTQAVCDSPEKVAFLAGAGISRAILARELSLEEIRSIRRATDIELEAFVFGALCVGESGRCYLSGAICDRSGNRGECAQPCRALWNLVDEAGRVLVKGRHLLSIQDLDLSNHLEEMADAGISSFKIEGRLKDADYVKNVVSHLRKKLDALLDRRPELGRASLGRVNSAFVTDPTKTFQRGLSIYRIDGERRPMGTPECAGHLGEWAGVVRSIQGDRVTLDGARRELPVLHPGDGLVFLDKGEVAGTLVNGVEKGPSGNIIAFLQNPSRMAVGMALYRNLDHQWLKALRAASVERRIAVDAFLACREEGVSLRLEDESGLSVTVEAPGVYPPVEDPARALYAVRKALSRAGDTPFALRECRFDDLRFIPISRLNALRREALEALESQRRAVRQQSGIALFKTPGGKATWGSEQSLDYRWNIANALSRRFYERHGARVLESAAELLPDMRGRVVMAARHCLRFEMGWCALHPNPKPWKTMPEPSGDLYLENGPTRLRCLFDCANCRMHLIFS